MGVDGAFWAEPGALFLVVDADDLREDAPRSGSRLVNLFGFYSRLKFGVFGDL